MANVNLALVKQQLGSQFTDGHRFVATSPHSKYCLDCKLRNRHCAKVCSESIMENPPKLTEDQARKLVEMNVWEKGVLSKQAAVTS